MLTQNVKVTSEHIAVLPQSIWKMRCNRHYRRHYCELPATLRSGLFSVRCRILDFSAGGARLAVNEGFEKRLGGREWNLEEPTLGELNALVVWRGSGEIGVRFDIGQKRAHRLEKLVAEMLGR